MAFGGPVGVVVDVVEGGDAAAVAAACGGKDAVGLNEDAEIFGVGTASVGGPFGGTRGTGFRFLANGDRDRLGVVVVEDGGSALAAVAACFALG